jgi:flagellar biosynthetic protein FliR
VFPPGTLEAFALYIVRTSVLVLASPLFGSGVGLLGAQAGLIGVLSLVLYSVSGEPLEHPIGPLEFGALAMREALIGFSLAFVLQLAMLAVRVAGEMIGHEMGFTMASLVDPETGINTPLVTQLYEGLFLLGLFAVDGHHLMIRALAESCAKAPVGVLRGVAGTAALFESLVGRCSPRASSSPSRCSC